VSLLLPENQTLAKVSRLLLDIENWNITGGPLPTSKDRGLKVDDLPSIQSD
jgi:hypothetical protein